MQFLSFLEKVEGLYVFIDVLLAWIYSFISLLASFRKTQYLIVVSSIQQYYPLVQMSDCIFYSTVGFLVLRVC